MNIGIISINSAFPAQTEKENILGLNGKLSENGLIISENQALSIAEARESSLQSNGRIDSPAKQRKRSSSNSENPPASTETPLPTRSAS